MLLPQRQTARLRTGRVSVPGATYFVTACVHHRAPVLTESRSATGLISTLSHLHERGDASIIAATIMPDHVHLLFPLGGRLSLMQVVAKLKALSRRRHVSWEWQDNVFEHRLRADEARDDYRFYIFMNPYAAKLIPTTACWPWWYCPEPSACRFLPLLHADGTPPREWLREREVIRNRLHVS
ncbi:hypothetical protein Oter_2468 [Opitutus terrae PB90-1]|uniref:Transposase IS200-like domain-containing protein n=2 Tax=Opitutus terrae TaxID=107709 RepID=B1ZSE8_OPITP|nr:transposase [Opitutus terrae]ACB75750.1 hypothetical protein Oter_2468 [Opitutus terrae PB90-1]